MTTLMKFGSIAVSRKEMSRETVSYIVVGASDMKKKF